MTEHTEASVRAEVRAWLNANWDPDLRLLEWRNLLVDSGWGMPQWPNEWFGRELSVGFLRIIDEEFKRVDAITVARKGATTLAGQTILAHGSNMLKEKFLRRSLTGEDAWCQLFSEPGNGSDLAGAVTRAERKGDKYIVNGQKVWTSGMDIAKYCLLVARTSKTEKKQQGITNFLVDTSLPGIEIQKIDTLGHRGIGTTQVFYSDVRVPADMTLGDVDEGWTNTDAYLWYERLCLSAARYGAATSAFEYALQYAKEREQFGRPIGKFQAISHKLADMKVMLENSRLLVYQFAWKMARGAATRHDAAIVKLYSGETYKTVSDMGLQILGGYGFANEYPMERFFRDSRLAVIGGGTSEIQRNIIAKNLGL